MSPVTTADVLTGDGLCYQHGRRRLSYPHSARGPQEGDENGHVQHVGRAADVGAGALIVSDPPCNVGCVYGYSPRQARLVVGQPSRTPGILTRTTTFNVERRDALATDAA